MHAETLAPYRIVSSRTISLTDGSKILDKYLSNSTSYPHLHPDALITPSGVAFSSHGGSSGGVIMHNLRRVAAGLHGEYLEPEPTPEPEDSKERSLGSQKKVKHGKKAATDATVGTQEEWQTMSEFEREEGVVEVGEVGDRINVVQEGGEVPELKVVDDAEAEDNGKKTKKDKEARKQAKKARNKEMRAQKEKARAEKTT